MCSTDELNEEYNHRAKLLKEERASKRRVSNITTCVALTVGIAIAIWYQIKGEATIAMFLIGIFGVIVPFMTGNSTLNKVTEFEQRQLDALKEIEYLLRERS